MKIKISESVAQHARTNASVKDIRAQLDENSLVDGEYVILIHKEVYNKGRIAVAAFQNFEDYKENVHRVTNEIIAHDPDDGIYHEWITLG